MHNCHLVANKADLKLAANQLFTELRNNNFSMKRTLQQDNLALLLTGNRQKWSSLIASLDESYHSFSFSSYGAIHGIKILNQKSLFNEYIFPLVLKVLDITARKNIAVFSVEAMQNLNSDLFPQQKVIIKELTNKEVVDLDLSDPTIFNVIGRHLIPVQGSVLEDWFDKEVDYATPMLCRFYGLEDFSKESLGAVNSYEDALIKDRYGDIEPLSCHIEKLCENERVVDNYFKPSKMNELLINIYGASELTMSVDVDSGFTDGKLETWIHLDSNLFAEEFFEELGTQEENTSLLISNEISPFFRNPKTPKEALLRFADNYIYALEVWNSFTGILSELVGGNSYVYDDIKGLEKIEQQFFKAFHDELIPLAEMMGKDALALHKRMPVNLSKILREIADYSFEEAGFELFAYLKERERFDFVKQELQLTCEKNEGNMLAAEMVKSFAESKLGFPLQVKWFSEEDFPSKYYFGLSEV